MGGRQDGESAEGLREKEKAWIKGLSLFWVRETLRVGPDRLATALGSSSSLSEPELPCLSKEELDSVLPRSQNTRCYCVSLGQ